MTQPIALSWPRHLLTLDEWEALPEDSGMRLELAEGTLVMTPMPRSWHQKTSMRLSSRLDEDLPDELTTLIETEVVLPGRLLTIRVPDVVVTRTELYEENPPRYPAADILLAVEVLSDGTRRVDRVLKFSEYAEAGIPQYWIVDVDPPTTLLAYVLVDAHYELSGEFAETVTLDVAGHPVTVDVATLTRRR